MAGTKPGHDGNKKGETKMPEITVSMAAGRTDEQKAGMMRDITQALVKNLGVDADAVVIQINELTPHFTCKISCLVIPGWCASTRPGVSRSRVRSFYSRPGMTRWDR